MIYSFKQWLTKKRHSCFYKQTVTRLSKQFTELWSDADVNMYAAETKENYGDVVCGTIQSVSANIKNFKPDEFGYIIIDEAHHGAADSYKKVLGYFNPEFTLGLTATPERADGEEILELFKNVAHRLDLQTAVERNELVPVRCIRIRTNIDLTNVRFNGVKYNFLDLETKMYIPERNNLIVDTYLNYVKDKKTVIFCVSKLKRCLSPLELYPKFLGDEEDDIVLSELSIDNYGKQINILIMKIDLEKDKNSLADELSAIFP